MAVLPVIAVGMLAVTAEPYQVAFFGGERIDAVAWLADGRIVHTAGRVPPVVISAPGLFVAVEPAVFRGTRLVAQTYQAGGSDVPAVAGLLADSLGVTDHLRGRTAASGAERVNGRPAAGAGLVLRATTAAPPPPADLATLQVAGELLARGQVANAALAAEQARQQAAADVQAVALAAQREAAHEARVKAAIRHRQADGERLHEHARVETGELTASLAAAVQTVQQAEDESRRRWHEQLQKPLPHESLMGKLANAQAAKPSPLAGRLPPAATAPDRGPRPPAARSGPTPPAARPPTAAAQPGLVASAWTCLLDVTSGGGLGGVLGGTRFGPFGAAAGGALSTTTSSACGELYRATRNVLRSPPAAEVPPSVGWRKDGLR